VIKLGLLLRTNSFLDRYQFKEKFIAVLKN
jgi:hypothetical protein